MDERRKNGQQLRRTVRVQKASSQTQEHHILRKVLIVLSLFVIVFVGFVGATYVSVAGAVQASYQPLSDQGSSTMKKVDLSTGQPVADLFLIVSNHKLDNVVVLTFNPQKKTTTFIKLDHDLYLSQAKKTLQEIYSQDGIAAVRDNLQTFLDVPLSYYAQMDMAGLGELVKATGGVSVYNQSAFIASGYEFPRGQIAIKSSDEAQAYITAASSPDEENDTYCLREQKILMALLSALNAKSIVKNYFPLLKMANQNVRDDFTMGDLENFALHYKASVKHLAEASLFTTPSQEDGKSVQIALPTDLNNFQTMIKNSLES